MFGNWSYVAILGFIVVGSFWLEFAFKLRVIRDPIRLLKTIALSTPLFIAWDAYAIANDHWFFSPSQTLGIYGPFGIPLEEYLFFLVVPVAGLLTLESVSKELPKLTAWTQKVKARRK